MRIGVVSLSETDPMFVSYCVTSFCVLFTDSFRGRVLDEKTHREASTVLDAIFGAVDY